MRKREQQGNGRTIFYHYLISYFTVLFIPLFICCIYYLNVISVISEDDMLARKSDLEHSSALVETMIDEFSYLGDSLVVNEEVNIFKYVEDAFAYPESYRINELQKMLPDLNQINQSVFDYYIFFDKSEMVLNRQIAYEYQDFYELYLRESDSVSYEEWYYAAKEEEPGYGLYPVQSYFYKGEEKNLLVYIRPLILNGGTGDNSVVKIYMESAMLDTLMPVMEEGGIGLITNRSGEVLYCSSKGVLPDEKMKQIAAAVLEQKKDMSGTEKDFTLNVDREKYVAVFCESEEYGLTYYTIQSERTANQRLMATVITVTSFILMAAAVGMILSYRMSLRSSMPINDILKEISKETEYYEGHQAVFYRLKATYRDLIHTNSNLAAAIENQKPFIRNAFINRLIFGNLAVKREAEKTADCIGVQYENRRFCVIIFRFNVGISELESNSSELMNSCAISLMELLELVMPGSLYANLGDEQVVLIMDDESQDQMLFRKKAEEIIVQIKEEMPSNIAEKLFVYGGNLVDSLSDIHESYNNASYMFQNEKGQIENAVIWYMGNSGMIPVYPAADLEMKLTHYVTTGNQKGLHDELSAVMTTYIIRNNLPAYLQHMLLNELQIIMFRILRHVDMEEADYWNYYKELEENHALPLLDQITKTLRIYRSVCEYVSNQKQVLDTGSLMPSVVKYIDSNYGSSDISLTSVADVFQISEPYLSSVFKQSVGINFSAYLEGVRIDKAKELLRTTRMSISEISGQVGYYSVNSFCRAFKRVTGISASEYRRALKNE